MRVFIVRRQDDRQLVGVFVAGTLSGLSNLVDECCNAVECEYRSISTGGLYWPRVAPAVPLKGDDPSLGDASLTESWWDEMDSDGRWKLMPPSDIDLILGFKAETDFSGAV